MPSPIDLNTVRQGLHGKSSLQLLDILSFTQDDYNPVVIPIIEEILIERGVPSIDVNACKYSYGNIIENLKKQPELRKQAGFFIRVCNYTFDHFIFFGICYLIQYVLSSFNLLDHSGRYEFFCLVAYVLYFSITISLFSATIGMLVLGLMVTDYDKKTVGFSGGFSRGCCMLLNYLTLSFGHLIMLDDKNKRTWPDKWSKTIVVHRG